MDEQAAVDEEVVMMAVDEEVEVMEAVVMMAISDQETPDIP